MPRLPSVLIILVLLSQVKANSIQFEQLTITEALKRAKLENKFIFVDFYADWCRPCKNMEKEVFLNDSIGDLFSTHFIALRVDAERDQPDYVASLQVETYPTLAFYDPKGRLIFKQEGALSATAFYQLSESLVNLNTHLENYKKNDRKKENVYEYVNAIRWINKPKASGVARKFLLELKEKEYIEPTNWDLISNYIKPWDRIMFPRILKSEILKQEMPAQFGDYLSASMEQLLDYAIEKRNSNALKVRKRYIQANASFLPNIDSLLLIGDLFYSAKHGPDEYPTHLKTYVKDYLPRNPSIYSGVAHELIKDYFQRPVLNLAIGLAKESIEIQPTSNGYLALALAYEKLLSYKTAYAYLLLGFQFVNEDEMVALREVEGRLKHKIELELASGVAVVDSLGTDGRFTLGAGKQRLMYGYPVPQSTSHFVVNIDGKLASNSPFSSKVKHITGQTVYQGTGATPGVVTKFEFEGVSIIQTLTPVDKEGVTIEKGFAQYYRVEYEMSTKKIGSKKVGLSLLFDTMMDDNDACAIAAKGKIIPHEYQFSGKSIPSELLFYRTPNDTSDLMGAALIDELEATKPDLMVVGRWPFLHKVEWKFKAEKVKYGDSAYLLRWQNRFLNNKKPLTFITYYGLPSWKQPQLRVIMKDDNGMLTLRENIYFEHNKSQLDINAKMKIQEMLENESFNIIGVTLNGYADISGDGSYNFDLSQKRIAAVGKIFTAFGIPYVPKPYGYQHSETSALSRLYGNAFDRKVEIVMYYQLQNQGIAQ